jgi:hypothetical protein
MALGGGKIGGAKKGRIKTGMQTDKGEFNERPIKDALASASASASASETADHSGGSSRTYLDMSTGQTSSSAPPNSQQHFSDNLGQNEQQQQQPPPPGAGPIEKKRKHVRGENGVSSDGPMPLSVERRGKTLRPPHQMMAEASDIAVAQQQQQQQLQMDPNTMQSDVNIINHTDVSLRMIAVDTAGSGRKVERTLHAKSGDNFMAPLGCTISIIHPVTQKAVFRHKVTDASTTLAVTDAALSGSGGGGGADHNAVGSSGKWYDNRAYVAAAGAGVVCGLLLIAALIALLVRYFLKRQKMKIRLGSAAASGWQQYK